MAKNNANYVDPAELRCPFYRLSGKDGSLYYLSCEGLMDNTRDTRNYFFSAKDRNEERDKLCCGDYEYCPYYRAVYLVKYGGDTL